MTEVAVAGTPALAQNAIIHVIDFADDAIARNDATRKAEAFRLVKVLIKSAAAGTISLDAAKCDHVECLVQTLHLSALAAEVDEEAKGASRLEMQQLRATILRMKASTPSTAAARAPPAVAPRTEPAAPPSSEPAAVAPASLTAAAASSPGQRKGAWLKAEWQFASMAKDHWIRGLLPACFEGLQLRAALAKLLKCDPMRVSKRADLGGGGGGTYKVAATEQELEAAAMERAPLEAAFDAACLDPLAPKAPRAPKKRPRADTAESPSDLRKGAWTDEEVVYARKIVDQYWSGDLPASLNGRTLNQILQEALNCDMLRVSKKMKTLGGDGSMKTYVAKATATASELAAAATELATLRAAYITSLAPNAPKKSKHEAELRKNQTPFASGDAAFVAAVSKAERVARGNDVAAQKTEFESFRLEVLAAAKKKVPLDAAARARVRAIAEVLWEKTPSKDNKGHAAMSRLRDKIEQLGPQAPQASLPAAVVAKFTKQLEDAAAVARRAVDAKDGHEGALRALAPVVEAASRVVPTSESVWKGVGEVTALLRSKAIPKKNEDPKGYNRVDNFVSRNIRKHIPDKTLPKVGSVNGRSERTTADPERSGLVTAADGPLVLDGMDFDALALAEDDEDGDVASILREPVVTIDAAAAARREDRRRENRLRSVAADENDQRSPEERRRALEAVPRSLMTKLEAVSASNPDEDAGYYIGVAIVPRAAPLNGSLGEELFAYYLRDNCALLCADTGLRLSMDQLRLLHASGALEFVRSVPDQNPALVGDCENTAQVLGRRMVPPGRGQRIPFYGRAAYGGVDDMHQPALLYASVLWFEKAREAGIEVCLGQVSIVTQRSLALSNETSFLGKPVGDNAGAFRRAMEALSSPVAAAASGASVTCLARPPPYGDERGWSFWGIAGVGHHVFVVWFVEDSRIHCKRVNFCEGGERLALAMYMQLRRAKLRDARGRLVCSSLPLEPGFVVGKLSDDVEEVDPEDEDLVECLLSLDDEPPALAVAPQTAAGDVLEGLYQGDLLELDESNATVSVAAAAPEPVLEPVDAVMTVAPPARKRSQPVAEPPAPKRPRAAAPFKPRGPRRNPGGVGGQMMRRQTGLLGWVEEWPRHVLPRHVFGDITNPRPRED